MKVFKQISYDPEPSVIGVDNGIYQLEFKKKALKKNRNYKEIEQRLMTFDLDEQDKIAELPIENLEGTLLKKAKITDLMVFTPYFFGYKYLISQKVVNLLEEAVAKEEYHLRKVEIDTINTIYYLLFVPMIPITEINFTQSRIFPEREYLLERRSYLSIDSYAGFADLLEENPFVSFENICLPEKYSKRDILSIQGEVDLFFSEELIKCFMETGVTNFRVPKRQIELVFTHKKRT